MHGHFKLSVRAASMHKRDTFSAYIWLLKLSEKSRVDFSSGVERRTDRRASKETEIGHNIGRRQNIKAQGQVQPGRFSTTKDRR